jgi:Papain-like cysteine protease AvrRpt2
VPARHEQVERFPPVITRRAALCGLTGSLFGATTYSASALEQCPAEGMPSETCTVLIDRQRFLQIATPAQQQNSEWCWAACIQMLCRWYGIRISQESIVRNVYGELVNAPADDITLTRALNSSWRSDDNQLFKMTSKIFSPALERADVNNKMIIEDLANEHPLIMAARSHAMLVARVDYKPGRFPVVYWIHVIDPWPGAAPPPKYARLLDRDEMAPAQVGGSLRYIASVRIS